MFRTLKPFEYLEPKSLEEAVSNLSKYGKKAKVYAAGIDLVPRMRKRQIHPECIVNIEKIAGLDKIEETDEGLNIGSLSTLRTIELSPLVRKNYMVLYEAIHSIASVLVKEQGTAVGNLCVATPASDVAPALIASNASLKIAGTSGNKVIFLENFYAGVGKTVLEPSDIVVAIILPKSPANTGGAFSKLVRTAADIAKINVAVTMTMADNTCKDLRIVLGSVAPTVFRAKKAEEILLGRRVDQNLIEDAASEAAGETKPISDLRSTAEYRKDTARVLVKRTLEEALKRARE